MKLRPIINSDLIDWLIVEFEMKRLRRRSQPQAVENWLSLDGDCKIAI